MFVSRRGKNTHKLNHHLFYFQKQMILVEKRTQTIPISNKVKPLNNTMFINTSSA